MKLLSRTKRLNTSFALTILLCLAAFVWMEWIAVTAWLSGHWYLADVGYVNSALVSTMSGRFMYIPQVQGSAFGYHFWPTLALLSPVTWFSSYPLPLVTCYALAIALWPLPIYALARQAGLHGMVAAALGFLFLANHFTASIQLAWHYEVILVLLVLCTMAAMRRGGYAFWICAFAALGTKEDAAVWLGVYAAYTWFFSENQILKRRAIQLGILCIVYFLVAVAVILATATGQKNNASVFLERLGTFGVSREGAMSLLAIIASAGFLPLFAGRAALLLLIPAAMLLPGFPFTRNLLYYYSYPFMSFLVLVSIHGAANLTNWISRRPALARHSIALVSAVCVLGGAIQIPMATRTDGYKRFPFEVTSRDEYRFRIAHEILPKDVPAVIQFGLWGITPTRMDARDFTQKNITPEVYVFLDLKAPRGGMPASEYIKIVQGLTDEAGTGKRTLLHNRHDILIFGPASNPPITPPGASL